MTPVPCRTNRRISSCRVSTSASLSAAVGSSMISTRGSYDNALAISTICWLGTVGPPAPRGGVEGGGQPAQQLGGGGVEPALVEQQPTTPRFPADEDVLRDGQ